MNVWGDERLILGRGWWMSEVMNVRGDECLRWWMSEVMNVRGDECLILGRGWWMSEVMNVLGDECRGDECRTIDKFCVKIEHHHIDKIVKLADCIKSCKLGRSVHSNWIFPPSRCKSLSNSRQMETGKYKIPGKQKGNEILEPQVARKSPQTQLNQT